MSKSAGATRDTATLAEFGVQGRINRILKRCWFARAAKAGALIEVPWRLSVLKLTALSGPTRVTCGWVDRSYTPKLAMMASLGHGDDLDRAAWLVGPGVGTMGAALSPGVPRIADM